MTQKKVVKVDESTYEAAKVIAAERNLNMGDAVVEVGRESVLSASACTESGFQAELRARGLNALPLSGVLLNALENCREGIADDSPLAPYKAALEAAEVRCLVVGAAEQLVQNAPTNSSTDAEVPAVSEDDPGASEVTSSNEDG